MKVGSGVVGFWPAGDDKTPRNGRRQQQGKEAPYFRTMMSLMGC